MTELVVKDTALLLCETKLTDVPAIYQFINSDRVYLRQSKDWIDAIRSPADEFAYVERMIRQSQEKLFNLVLGDQIIGSLNLHHVQLDQGVAEMGYWLHSAYHHHGYMTQAVKELTAYALNNYQLKQIEVLIAKDHVASQGVVARAGYQLMGQSKQSVYYQFIYQDALLWRYKKE